MNDTYIDYINELLDLAERKDFLCLTSEAFNEFAAEVREAMDKQYPLKVHDGDSCVCGRVLRLDRPIPNNCPNCGQKLDWEV